MLYVVDHNLNLCREKKKRLNPEERGTEQTGWSKSLVSRG